MSLQNRESVGKVSRISDEVYKLSGLSYSAVDAMEGA